MPGDPHPAGYEAGHPGDGRGSGRRAEPGGQRAADDPGLAHPGPDLRGQAGFGHGVQLGVHDGDPGAGPAGGG